MDYTNVDLRALITHREWVDANHYLGQVYKKFGHHKVDFMAVLDQGRLLGLCSRAEIGMLLGHQYGHSLYARNPICHHLLKVHLQVADTDPITEILNTAFKRREAHFFDDIILTDSKGGFIGLIQMRSLVTLQNRFFLDNINSLEAKQTELNQKNQQMQENLLLAQQLQQAILPNDYPCFPSAAAPGQSLVRFYHYYQSAELLGGDFFHIIPLSDFSVGIFICDVLGHGVRSALITAMMRALVATYRNLAKHPGRLLKRINQKFCQMLNHHPDSIFATADFLYIDLQSRRFRFASAGHHVPLLVNRQKNNCHPLQIDEDQVGLPLGILEKSEYGSAEGIIDIGDMFLVYTDGLFEVFNDHEEAFGQARLNKVISRHSDKVPSDMFDAILKEVRKFSGNGGFQDDVCLVAVEVVDMP
ncbi:MAG: SpoIIE family protein phosphatase [Desulfobacterales bacterium]|jgi:serine phosphatase RsbU (regulator of sigma subunit)